MPTNYVPQCHSSDIWWSFELLTKMKLLHATWGEHCILRWSHPTRSSLAICVISPCSSGNTVSDFFRLSTSQWWVCEGDSNTFISWKSPHLLLEIMQIALERMSPLHSLCAHLAEKGCTFYATCWYAWKDSIDSDMLSAKGPEWGPLPSCVGKYSCTYKSNWHLKQQGLSNTPVK